MDVTAKAKYVRMSPHKGRDFARSLRGLPVSEALKMTEFSPRKAAFFLGKTLKSAIANAGQNSDVAIEGFHIKEAVVDDGPSLKRYWPRARGAASPIKKRTCHIRIVLTDGVEAAEA